MMTSARREWVGSLLAIIFLVGVAAGCEPEQPETEMLPDEQQVTPPESPADDPEPVPETPEAAGAPNDAEPPGVAALPDAAEAAPPPGEAPADPVLPPFQGTLDPIQRVRDLNASVVLHEIRSWAHPHFERVVFEFRGDQIPGYEVQYVSAPVRECASGYAVEVAGGEFLEIRTQPARMYEEIDQRRRTTIRDRERAINRPLLRNLVHTCDYQDVVAWVAGLSGRRPYRVLELRNPPRLVVDISTSG